jgi:transposase InsO family protein
MLMPWKEQSIMELREEFCRLALSEGVTMRELCRRFGISPTTGYTWRARYQEGGRAELADHSRRPHTSPAKTTQETEAQVLRVRAAHPCWGGRKIRAVLLRERGDAPSASTITQILARHHCLAPEASLVRQHPIRFEAPFPNALWQMDFKGYLMLADGSQCHPLTVLDDHSRFSLGVRALPTQQGTAVKAELTHIFQRYGLPNRILCDNGGPWGSSVSRFSALGVWLLHLDVVPIHGRPYHPQTQGKDERFHRTLMEEVVQARSLSTSITTSVPMRPSTWRCPRPATSPVPGRIPPSCPPLTIRHLMWCAGSPPGA